MCAIAATAFESGMAFCFYIMQSTRQQLAIVGHDGYTDNEWGFRQAVALFAWIPLVAEMLISLVFAGAIAVLNVCGRVKPRRKGDAEGNEMDYV
jgi:hydrogenase-4 membrane subunit HyfE